MTMKTSTRLLVRRASLLALVPALGGALVAGPALASSHQHADALRDDHGFVVAVATNDAFLKVKTADHGDLTLAAAGKALRRQIDAASVTDYVEVTYESPAKGKLVLRTLRDTSVSGTGKVSVIASNHKLITVRTGAHGSLKLHILKPALIAQVKLGESVDIDYYKAANDEFMLVDIGHTAPLGATGSGKGGTSGSGKGSTGGSAGSGSSDSSAGSGSSGSSGGSSSFGSAGSGSWGSAGSSSAA
jgi:hypothetical protein